MKKPIIIANWKMNPASLKEARALFLAVARVASRVRNSQIVVCPPFVWLSLLGNFKKSEISLGAQNVFWEYEGAYTGEISIDMLKDLGVEYIIIGHSERRRNLIETDEMINKKIKLVLKNGIKAVFCVGEAERDEAGNYLHFVREEIINGLEGIPLSLFKNLIVTYEPVWAISSASGSDKPDFHPDTPEDAFQMATYIKRILFSLFGKRADGVPILYGGSVDVETGPEFLKKGNVDGLLVGRTSWNAEIFGKLLKNVNQLQKTKF